MPVDEEENWDDDFEFSNSPRHSPVPGASPIHSFSQQQHQLLRHQQHQQQQSSTSSSSVNPNNNRYLSRSRSDLQPTALPRHMTSRSHLAATATAQTQHGKSRLSGNSESDWDLDEPTLQAPPQQQQQQQASQRQPQQARPAAISPPPPAPVVVNVVPHPTTMSNAYTDLHIQPRPSIDSPAMQHLHPRAETSQSGGNVSPTMSAFSIPLSIDSSLRHAGGHAGERSIGGSSTNFLLHTGRRSVLEIEKGRQERERRKLRKKSRPSAGAVAVGGDDDEYDVYGSGRRAAVPRRYAAPRRDAREDGQHSSSDGRSSDEDDDGLSELEEEHVSPQPVASSSIIKTPSRLLNLALNPARSHDKLSAASSTPPTSSSAMPRQPHSGVGSRSTTITSVPLTSGSGSERPTPGHGQGSSRLVRKVSNSNVLVKPHPSPKVSGARTLLPPQAPSAHASRAGGSREPMSAMVTRSQAIKAAEPIPATAAVAHPADEEHDDEHDTHRPAPAKDDCGASIAASVSSHKEGNKRSSMLGRLGSLKRWGKHDSPSSSGLALPRPTSNKDASVSPRMFGTSRLPSLFGGSRSDLRTSAHADEGPSSTPAAGRGKSGLGLGRKPSLILNSPSSSALAAQDASSHDALPTPTTHHPSTPKRGLNPFRRVSIQGVKKYVAEHAPLHHHGSAADVSSNGDPTSSPDNSPQKKDKDGHRVRTLSFTALARGKLGSSAAAYAASHTEKAASRSKEVLGHGRKSSDGRETGSSSNVHAPSQGPVGPHTLGRTAAMAKAPRTPVKGMTTAIPTRQQERDGYEGSGSNRIPLPSSISTATSAGYQSSSATSAAHSSMHKRNTSATTASSISQSSPVSTSPPFALPTPEYTKSLGPSHSREPTARPSLPYTSSSSSKTASFNSAALPPSENTPRPRGHGSKPLPDVGSGAMTLGRLEGKNAASSTTREPGIRRGSEGDPTRAGATPQKGLGQLKIPARISMRQDSLKRELEAVKEFAISVDDLKRLQGNRESLLAALAPASRRSSSRASNQPANLAAVQSIESKYAMWWECADLLIELGGAAPPVVAGTPIYETSPTLTKAPNQYGSHRSGSSSSSATDLSTRQLDILRKMLSTPDPRAFGMASSSSTNQSSTMRRGDVSNSGSDHMHSDRGTKSSADSAGSLRDATQVAHNYPYSQGTWKGTRSRQTPPTAGGSRPNLSGIFPNASQQKGLGSKSASRATLADESGSSRSGAGRTTTTDADEDDISDWDAESASDSANAARKSTSTKPASSNASSSVDFSHPLKLALTPETIMPLLSYAKEVKVKLVNCLEELQRVRTAGRSSSSTQQYYQQQQQQSSSHQYGSTRAQRAPESGTSTLRRA